MDALKDRSRSVTEGRTHARLLGSFVVAQFALALVVTIGAGLLARSYVRLLTTDPGFRSEEVVHLSITLPSGRYVNGSQVRGFQEQTRAAALAISGVQSAAVASDLPMKVRERRSYTADKTEGSVPRVIRQLAPTWTSPGYFETLRIPLRRGRLFTESDGPKSQPVIVINDALARLLWPNEDPIGRRMKSGSSEASLAPWMTVIGVVGDAKHSAADLPAAPQLYIPTAQEADGDLTGELFRTFDLMVRSNRNADSLIADLLERVRQIDSALPVSKAEPLSQIFNDSAQPRQFSMIFVLAFAVIALGLAATGIYGVLSRLL